MESAAPTDPSPGLPERRWRLAAASLVTLQAIAALVGAASYLVELIGPDAVVRRNVAMLVALLLVLGLGLLLLARGLWHGRRGSRAPVITWQLIILAIAYNIGGSGRWGLAGALAITPLLTGYLAVRATVDRA